MIRLRITHFFVAAATLACSLRAQSPDLVLVDDNNGSLTIGVTGATGHVMIAAYVSINHQIPNETAFFGSVEAVAYNPSTEQEYDDALLPLTEDLTQPFDTGENGTFTVPVAYAEQILAQFSTLAQSNFGSATNALAQPVAGPTTLWSATTPTWYQSGNPTPVLPWNEIAPNLEGAPTTLKHELLARALVANQFEHEYGFSGGMYDDSVTEMVMSMQNTQFDFHFVAYSILPPSSGNPSGKPRVSVSRSRSIGVNLSDEPGFSYTGLRLPGPSGAYRYFGTTALAFQVSLAEPPLGNAENLRIELPGVSTLLPISGQYGSGVIECWLPASTVSGTFTIVNTTTGNPVLLKSYGDYSTSWSALLQVVPLN